MITGLDEVKEEDGGGGGGEERRDEIFYTDGRGRIEREVRLYT